MSDDTTSPRDAAKKRAITAEDEVLIDKPPPRKKVKSAATDVLPTTSAPVRGFRSTEAVKKATPLKATISVTVKLGSQYNIYPLKLRASFEEAYKKALRLHSSVESPSEGLTALQYVLCKARFTPGSSIEAEVKRIGCYISLVEANIEAMDVFMESHKRLKSARSKKGEEPPEFVENDANPKVANPDFIHHNAIRYRDCGWGLDIDGCVSFHTVTFDGSKVKTHAVYVQRMECKREEQEILTVQED